MCHGDDVYGHGGWGDPHRCRQGAYERCETPCLLMGWYCYSDGDGFVLIALEACFGGIARVFREDTLWRSL
jgi:hypothetical protein